MLLTAPSRTTALRRAVVAALPAVTAGSLILAALLAVNTPPTALLRYAAFWLLAVLLPGTLVHRALRGRNPSLVIDLALGGATGLALGLAAWAVYLTAGIQEYLWTWPLAVLVPFAAIPSLRQHWRLRVAGHHSEDGRVTAWLLAGAVSLYALALAVTTMRYQDLPPRANSYYIDVYWHLANAAELSRQLPPDVPSLAGRTLRYHWFASAHMAEAHLVSGVDLPTVILRLWEIPVVAIILALVLAVARKATGAYWPGAVAALLIVAPAQLMPWGWYKPWGSYALTEGSPTQVFGLVFLLLMAHILIGLVRGERVGAGGWTVLLLAAAAGAGSKPAVLPILLSGLGCVALLEFVRRRPVRGLLAAIGLLAAMFVAMGALVAQAAAASGFKLFGLLYFQTAWTFYSSSDSYPSTGGLLLAGLDRPAAIALALMLVGTTLLQFLWVLAAAPLLRRGTRTEPGFVLLAGGFAGSIAAMLVVDHAGASEIYFARTGVPFAAILAGWGLYAVLPKGSAWFVRRTGITLVVGAALTATAIVLAVAAAARGPRPRVADYPREIAIPLAVLLLGTALVFAGWRLARATRWPALRGFGMVFFCFAILAGFMLQGPWNSGREAWSAATGTRDPLPPGHVTRLEATAAQWVSRNTPRDDIIATNVHCVGKRTRPRCDSRAHWVVGLTERRALVESWGNAEETLQQIGLHERGGFGSYPFDTPALLALNDRAFTSPTPQVLAELRDRYGVRWLFAVRMAGPVSPALTRLADLRLDNQHVQVFELRSD